MSEKPNKEYLGDGVYADHDGNGVVLTTENGLCATNTIYLEPEVIVALQAYMEKLRRRNTAREVG